MSRAAALILTAGLAVATPPAIVGAGRAGSGAGPVAIEAVPTTTTVVGAATSTVVPTTTVAAGPTTVVPTTVRRGGAAAGSVAKPDGADGWSIQRLVTTTALVVVALAAAGYAFGRFRSAPPVHPDLVRRGAELVEHGD